MLFCNNKYCSFYISQYLHEIEIEYTNTNQYKI